ncbi:hypothetical protein ACFL1S_04030 [Pseudomonadota bacterium]
MSNQDASAHEIEERRSVYVVCACCGEWLEGEDINPCAIGVEPCETCLASAREEGFCDALGVGRR